MLSQVKPTRVYNKRTHSEASSICPANIIAVPRRRKAAITASKVIAHIDVQEDSSSSEDEDALRWRLERPLCALQGPKPVPWLSREEQVLTGLRNSIDFEMDDSAPYKFRAWMRGDTFNREYLEDQMAADHGVGLFEFSKSPYTLGWFAEHFNEMEKTFVF